MRFRIVTVFDISQTEGKELPSIGVSELSGNIDRFEELANAITSVSPVPILYAAPPSAAKGCFNHVTEEILVRPGMSQKQTVKRARSKPKVWRMSFASILGLIRRIILSATSPGGARARNWMS